MKIKVNDIVAPKAMLGRVVDVKKDKVIFERTDVTGTIRTFEITEEHAKTRGVSLKKLIKDHLFIVDKDDLKDIE